MLTLNNEIFDPLALKQLSLDDATFSDNTPSDSTTFSEPRTSSHADLAHMWESLQPSIAALSAEGDDTEFTNDGAGTVWHALRHIPPGSTGLLKLIPESDEGNVEYKLKIDPNQRRYHRLVTQLNFRLLEGHGEARYMIGVSDNGHLAGSDYRTFIQSVSVLDQMASSIGGRLQVAIVMHRSANAKMPCHLAHLHPAKQSMLLSQPTAGCPWHWTFDISIADILEGGLKLCAEADEAVVWVAEILVIREGSNSFPETWFEWELQDGIYSPAACGFEECEDLSNWQ